MNTSQSQLSHSSSKKDLLETKQDLLSLKDDLKKLKRSLIEPEPNSTASDEFQDFESYESQQNAKMLESESHFGIGSKSSTMPHSTTCDSITEIQGKGYTPSMTSSGYGSQAVSTLTLSSEDSLSLRSNDDSEMLRAARKAGLEHASSGESDGDADLVQGQGQCSAINSNEDTEGKNVDMETVAMDTGNEGSKFEQSASDTTLENMDMEKVRGCEDDRSTDLDNGEKVSIKSDLTDIGAMDDSVKLHISEEDLSSEPSVVRKESDDKCASKSSLENVQCVNEENDESETKDCVFESNENNVSDIGESANNSENGTHGNNQSPAIQKSSDSSSNTSRGPMLSESIDPYSLEAMEELERLGEEFGNDNSEYVSMNETGDSIVDDTGNKKLVDVATSDNREPKGAAQGLDESIPKADIALSPEFQSTPKRREKRLSDVATEGRQRPVSCIVSSDTGLLDSSLQERSKRSSLDLSDEHLSGKLSLLR